MDWLALCAAFPRDRDLPDRAHRLTALQGVLNGTMYDALMYPFSTERSGSGEYVPLSQRRPSVRTGLCRVVTDHSVSLLFSEGRFPTIQSQSEVTREALAGLVKVAHLNQVMALAATRGSVGSVAILMQVLKNKPHFRILETAYLTPVWNPEDPDELLQVVERYKVRGRDLRDRGYAVDNDAADYWFERRWNTDEEIWYAPLPVVDARDGKPPRVDMERSVRHALGFVPIVWIKNLPAGDIDSPDGACTFEAAIDTVIQLDYLLSQGARALRYSSDPTLLLKDPAMGQDATLTGGAANALVLPPEGDAKLLEINGGASQAVIEYARLLREYALESIHGNRSSADRLTAAQSGKALELMHLTLVWLADRLRISYGEVGLLSLLRMVCLASERVKGGLQIGEQRYAGLDGLDLVLKWRSFFEPTYQDRNAEAQSIKEALNAGVISQQTGIAAIAGTYDIENVVAEQAAILADKDAAMSRAVDEGAAVQIREFASP